MGRFSVANGCAFELARLLHPRPIEVLVQHGGAREFALLGLLANVSSGTPIVSNHSKDPLLVRPPHSPPHSRQVIFLFMHRGVSHVVTFDSKPKLADDPHLQWIKAA